MADNSGNLKQSDAGITGGTNGSLGDASQEDLKRGYFKPSDPDLEQDRTEPGWIDDDTPEETAQKGFLNRPGQHKYPTFNWD